ncbi:hypothetical protein V9T40_008211 [Parthenolecanium corni]|uniref:Peptidase metallopeptidase domain-containing protein n=1 Tax=Parthenolecanium corni TaxID=536013 RepID=A0AAN9TRM2_9HEMI
MISRIICLLILVLTTEFIPCKASFGQTSQVDDATKYLSKFGYMRQYDPRLGSLSHDTTFKEGIREFQDFAGLKVTGELNNDTVRMMKMPRCGVKDKRNPKPVEHSRFRRYVLHGSKWPELKITYRITKYPSGLGESETDGDVKKAFDAWSEVSPLSFVRKTYGKADIEIRFESGDHGDEDPFDGRGGTLAHANFPAYGGDVHFDDDEIWTVKISRRSTNLFRVAVHEFGHSLGLEHSKVRGAVMYPFYTGADSDFQFHPDDIDGIQTIYGEKEKDSTDIDPITRRRTTTESSRYPDTSGSDNDLCRDGKFDAIFSSSHGSLYILKGSSYWLLGKEGLIPGYPKPISEKWIGLPSNIDAAFSSLNGRTYFFKGSKYWRFSGGTLDTGYPNEISDGFGGIPSNIDAAMWAHHLNKGFFFKGDKYWVFDADSEDKLSVKSSYPKSITNFKGIPSNLDDVLLLAGKVFFFKNGEYYRVSDYTLEFEKYLSKFGYMRQYEYDPQLGSLSHDMTFKEGICEFQDFAGLKVTGELNNDTVRMMKMPRCGVKDKRNPKPVEHSRFRRYVLHGSKWPWSRITYRITKYPCGLRKSKTDEEIKKAFDAWSEVIPLSFVRKTYGRANIEIRFESGDHGDEEPFDGPGGILAHAYFPADGGDVHFDDDEIWTVKMSDGGINLFRVAVHEIGHSLGLDHSKVRGAVMYPFYTGADSNFQFHPDDIHGIQTIYGEKEKDSTDIDPITRRRTTTKSSRYSDTSGSDNDLCKDGKFDAIFSSSHGSLYILKGSSYWLLGKEGLIPGYPKPISEKWIGLPSNIDTAFSSLNGRTYFFKGSKYWRFSGETLDTGYPNEISDGFEGIPSNIDAAMWAHRLNKGFFFKGDKYWVFDADSEDKLSVKSSYPKSITNFKGIPSNLDDVLLLAGKVFFFKNGEYYRVSDYTLEFEKYLSKFGYMRQYNPKLDSLSHETTFKEGIRELQDFAGLKVTGELNKETIKMLKMPRCGVKDKRNPKPVEHSRFRRYVLDGSKWPQLNITYRITKYPSGLGESETDGDVKKAFDAWSEVSPLNFVRITSGKADIEIRFESGKHGDVQPFDGPEGLLAHATSRKDGGWVHFDDDEIWTVKMSDGGKNLFRVAVHEIGHSLGLDHSEVSGAVMNERYTGADSDFQFHPDDIEGIQKIYGRKGKDSTSGSDNDLCKDGKFDAIFSSSHDSLYILKGSSYWLVGKEGLIPGYPKPISEKWIGLPSNIDAAFSSGLNGTTYFFKSSKYWRFSGGTLDTGYPKEISDGFEGIPSNIDAAMWSHRLNKGFFFKGDEYWVFDADSEDKPSVKSSYPKSITNFEGIPSNLDDVLLFAGEVYFFKNGESYDISGYNLKYEIEEKFLNCTKVSYFEVSEATTNKNLRLLLPRSNKAQDSKS